MLTSLTVERWKSIGSATLNIDPITILIGTNSSGKSNILDALSFLNRIANGAMITAALQGDTAFAPLRGGIEWAPQRPGDIFSIGVTLRANDIQDLEYKIECRINQKQGEVTSEQLHRIRYRLDKNGRRGSKPSRVALFWTDPVAPESPTITARLYNSKRGTPRQLSRASSVLFQLFGQQALADTKEGVDLALAALRSIFILDPIPSHMRGFSPLADRLLPDAGNIAGVLAALPDETKRAVESTLTKYVSKLPERDINKVFAETVGKFASDAMLYCEESYGPDGAHGLVDARGISDGTLRFLAILTALLTRPENSLLVIEEVDNGLHPSRSQLLVNMLAEVGGERSVDVMVTTHNPALLDALGPERVPFITVAHRDPESGETKLTLLEDIKLLPKLLAQGPVGRLSSQGLIEKALINQSSGF
ncbi:AAA family ATPase [Ancylobacter sp. WKF20]|uniref:AAA family ATPase n=1 Tax=Ancylobacter sp. WKF20 TaxID=3039801 RepID=UPI00243448E3|nr:ATP-binding protein [Ancylobacter sp. WKF20]WGD30171.1 AAA family ATPase [Ancylobacter sp. WKF20]